MVNLSRSIFVALLLAACSFAQSAGFKDLVATPSQPPQDHLARPGKDVCPLMNTGIADNGAGPKPDSARTPDPGVELAIATVSPAVLHIGELFTAVLRVKNVGSDPVLLPWETNGESVTRTSAGGEQESYEAVDIALRLKSGTHQLAPVWLRTAGALFGHPELKSSYIALQPGQWVDIKLKGTVACSDEGLPCGKLVADKHGALTAWWYQRQLTHRIHGCDEDFGNSVVRELESKPFEVAVTRPVPPAAK